MSREERRSKAPRAPINAVIVHAWLVHRGWVFVDGGRTALYHRSDLEHAFYLGMALERQLMDDLPPDASA